MTKLLSFDKDSLLDISTKFGHPQTNRCRVTAFSGSATPISGVYSAPLWQNCGKIDTHDLWWFRNICTKFHDDSCKRHEVMTIKTKMSPPRKWPPQEMGGGVRKFWPPSFSDSLESLEPRNAKKSILAKKSYGSCFLDMSYRTISKPSYIHTGPHIIHTLQSK